MRIDELLNTIGLEVGSKLLLGNNECSIFKIKNDDNLWDNPIVYFDYDLEHFGLVNAKTLRELILYINPKSAVCQIVGVKKFINFIREKIDNSKVDEVEQFYFPLKKGEKCCYLEATIYKTNEFLYFSLSQNLLEPTKFENLYSRSYIDPLTGLFNNVTLNIHIKDVIGTHYIGFIDLDNFKFINDTFSHAVGDECLAKIGYSIIANADERVIFYHRSGDEFIFITNDYGLEETKELIERIQNSIFGIEFYGLKIDASIGFTKYEKGIGYTIEEAINGADYAMYKAKIDKNHNPYYLSPEEIIKIKNESTLITELEKLSKLRRKD